jgi:hypothetical protein
MQKIQEIATDPPELAGVRLNFATPPEAKTLWLAKRLRHFWRDSPPQAQTRSGDSDC